MEKQRSVKSCRTFFDDIKIPIYILMKIVSISEFYRVLKNIITRVLSLTILGIFQNSIPGGWNIRHHVHVIYTGKGIVLFVTKIPTRKILDTREGGRGI